MVANRIRALRDLADLVREREFAKLAQANRARQASAEDLNAMRDARKRGLSQAAPDAAHRAGTDEAWLHHVDRTLSALSAKAAAAEAAFEEQRTASAKAFGRAQAIARIESKIKP